MHGWQGRRSAVLHLLHGIAFESKITKKRPVNPPLLWSSSSSFSFSIMYYIRMGVPSIQHSLQDQTKSVLFLNNRRIWNDPPLPGTKPVYSSTWQFYLTQGSGPSVALACVMKMIRRNRFQKVFIIYFERPCLAFCT